MGVGAHNTKSKFGLTQLLTRSTARKGWIPFPFSHLVVRWSSAFLLGEDSSSSFPSIVSSFSFLRNSIMTHRLRSILLGLAIWACSQSQFGGEPVAGVLALASPSVSEARTSRRTTLPSSSSSTTRTAKARVAFVAGSAPSGYGATSPLPNPSWWQVAQQLAKRLPHFVNVQEEDDNNYLLVTDAIDLRVGTDGNSDQQQQLQLDPNTNIVVVLGVQTVEEQKRLEQLLVPSISETTKNLDAVLCDPTCAPEVLDYRFAGSYAANGPGWQALANRVAPFSELASHQRLLEKADLLLGRKSSEDYLFAILFVLHSLVMPIDVVKSDINPSWEKGVLRNIQEFRTMVQCCGPEIQAALTHPQSKQAIDLLNDLDLRDQVGSYRVIVSNETPQLEDFTLCILQQNNCFQCDSPILQQPKVPLIEKWRGKPVDAMAARQILLGHLDHPDAAVSTKADYSWKIVVGANPAYDAFPMQHQIFYPSGGAGKGKTSNGGMWYDPVFCVETLDGELVWCKRHYRCTPRKHWSSNSSRSTSSTEQQGRAGAWTLTTLDNGMVSEEHWTTVDAADDLTWAVLHYSGAARRAGQSYVGALLCTADGKWPTAAAPGTPEWKRIERAFANCDLELWELFGGSHEESYMWAPKFTEWAEQNPPPLDRIGDMSITTWRRKMREMEAKIDDTRAESLTSQQ